MANALLRDMRRKLSESALVTRHEELANYHRAVNQERQGNNKIYSLEVLAQIKTVRGMAPEKAFCDRGFRGRKQIGGTTIALPGTPSPNASEYTKRAS